MIRVLVAATDPIVRAGLESILQASSDLSVVGIALDTDTLDIAIAEYSPDVVLLELSLPDEEPVTEKLAVLNSLATAPIIVVANTLQGDWISEALRLGIRAILPRSATAEEILQTAIAAAAGLVVLHADAIDVLLPGLPTIGRVDTSTPLQALTAREIEVLGMLAEGLGNKAIAKRLNISDRKSVV